jgi:hypothetical protein
MTMIMMYKISNNAKRSMLSSNLRLVNCNYHRLYYNFNKIHIRIYTTSVLKLSLVQQCLSPIFTDRNHRTHCIFLIQQFEPEIRKLYCYYGHTNKQCVTRSCSENVKKRRRNRKEKQLFQEYRVKN